MKYDEETIKRLCYKAVEGLAAQGFERCYVSELGCMELSYDGSRRCAVGYMLPLGVLTPGSIGGPAWSRLSKRKEALCAIDAMRLAHDRGHTPKNMRRLLRRVFIDRGWDVPKVLKGIG